MTDLKKQTTTKKIESPFAKYNNLGQLTCVICPNQVIKNELLWNTHVNSKAHLENKTKLKSKLQQQQHDEQTTTTSSSSSKTAASAAFKKPPPPSTSNNSSHTVAKNNNNNNQLKRQWESESSSSGDSATPAAPASRSSSSHLDQSKKPKMDSVISRTKKIDLNKLIEENDIDIPSSSSSSAAVPMIITTASSSSSSGAAKGGDENGDEMATTSQHQETEKKPIEEPGLPEGFFDDPELDAKVRGTTRAQTLENEYEEFKRAIQIEEAKSNTLVEMDDQMRDMDRDLEEVDELIVRWSKIEDLHRRREQIKSIRGISNSNSNNNNNNNNKSKSKVNKVSSKAINKNNNSNINNNNKSIDEDYGTDGDNDADNESSDVELDVDLNEIINLKLRNKKLI